jgi:hypothetical protein
MGQLPVSVQAPRVQPLFEATWVIDHFRSFGPKAFCQIDVVSCHFESLTVMGPGFGNRAPIKYLGVLRGGLRQRVGWDSNPEPTPKAFGAALPLKLPATETAALRASEQWTEANLLSPFRQPGLPPRRKSSFSRVFPGAANSTRTAFLP